MRFGLPLWDSESWNLYDVLSSNSIGWPAVGRPGLLGRWEWKGGCWPSLEVHPPSTPSLFLYLYLYLSTSLSLSLSLIIIVGPGGFQEHGLCQPIPGGRVSGNHFIFLFLFVWMDAGWRDARWRDAPGEGGTRTA